MPSARALAGALPHRDRRRPRRRGAGPERAPTCWPRACKAYVLSAASSRPTWHGRRRCERALRGADCVVAITPYASDEQLAHRRRACCPSAPFAETSGTYVNLEGRWQSVPGAANPSASRARLEDPARARQPARSAGLRVRQRRKRCATSCKREIGDAAPVAPAARVAVRRAGRLAALDATQRCRHLRVSMPSCVARRRCRQRSTARPRRRGAAPRDRCPDSTLAGAGRLAAHDRHRRWADPGASRHRDPGRGLPHAGRAQGHRLHAGAHRAQPRRSGKGLLQPFADVIKLLIKEVIVPSRSNKFPVPHRAAAHADARRSRPGP